MPHPRRTLWQRIRTAARHLWRGEAEDIATPITWGDLYDGHKGFLLLSMVDAWRKRRPADVPPTTPPGAIADQRSRDLARLLERYNPYAQGILSALRSYVLADKGLSIELKLADEEASEDEVLLLMAQSFLDEFMDRVDWWSRERELYNRCHRDGEGILRYFASADGVDIRFVEPEWVVPPDASPEWSEGVRQADGDAETIEALWMQTGITAAEGEELSAGEVYFLRCNIDGCLKRGLSDFASIAPTIEAALACLSSMIEAETERQKIVFIDEHMHSSGPDVERHTQGQSDYSQKA